MVSRRDVLGRSRAVAVGAAVGALVLIVLAAAEPGSRREDLAQQYQEDIEGDARPAHVSKAFMHSDGHANHNRFRGLGHHNDFEPDGGFPANTFSAASALAAKETRRRMVVGSGSLAKIFKQWVAAKVRGEQKSATSSLATMSLEEADAPATEEEDGTGADPATAEEEDATDELVFGFFIIFLPVIVLVIVLLILLPFMIMKATGSDGPSGAEIPGQEHLKSTSDLVVKYLSPVEEISPFKVGQIQKLISDVSEQAGTMLAPAFIVLQVLFLVAFVGYLVVAIVALCVDFGAMSVPCAEDSWVWLYVLLIVVIPTSLGFVMGLVRAGLVLADLKQRVGWEVPDLFLSLPGPVLYITLGILGIVLWAQMDEACSSMYAESFGMLFVVFKIQVIMMGIASIFGLITCFAQMAVLIASLTGTAPPPPPAADYTESKYV